MKSIVDFLVNGSEQSAVGEHARAFATRLAGERVVQDTARVYERAVRKPLRANHQQSRRGSMSAPGIGGRRRPRSPLSQSSIYNRLSPLPPPSSLGCWVG